MKKITIYTKNAPTDFLVKRKMELCVDSKWSAGNILNTNKIIAKLFAEQ
jgi:hypothetical protein